MFVEPRPVSLFFIRGSAHSVMVRKKRRVPHARALPSLRRNSYEEEPSLGLNNQYENYPPKFQRKCSWWFLAHARRAGTTTWSTSPVRAIGASPSAKWRCKRGLISAVKRRQGDLPALFSGERPLIRLSLSQNEPPPPAQLGARKRIRARRAVFWRKCARRFSQA